MAVAIFIEYENNVIKFPVNPPNLKVIISGNNSTTEVVKLGEINIAKDVKLAEISFDSFFPKTNNGPYILTSNQFKDPDFYIKLINDLRNNKKPLRFIVSETNINFIMLIESFEYEYEAGTDDINYSISLKEYREAKVATMKLEVNSNTTKPISSSNNNTSINKSPTVGCNVIVNGRLHRDSYGKGPGKTLTNYKGKINIIVSKSRSHPYHVTTPSGGHLGWVTPGSIKVI